MEFWFKYKWFKRGLKWGKILREFVKIIYGLENNWRYRRSRFFCYLKVLLIGLVSLEYGRINIGRLFSYRFGVCGGKVLSWGSRKREESDREFFRDGKIFIFNGVL